MGSPRYAHQLAMSGLRTRLLRRFPFLIVYRDELELGYSSRANGGNLVLVKSMATATRDSLNGFLTVLTSS